MHVSFRYEIRFNPIFRCYLQPNDLWRHLENNWNHFFLANGGNTRDFTSISRFPKYQVFPSLP